MTMVTEYDWENDTWTHHTEESERAAFRAAVAEIVAKAKASLHLCQCRLRLGQPEDHVHGAVHLDSGR